MQRLIKNGELINDEWTLVKDENFDLAELSQGQWALPLDMYEKAVENGSAALSRLGVILSSDQDVLALRGYLDKLPLVVINFAAFADGRSFSQARILREQLDYAGEIRAAGNYMQDQLFYLSRCGVDAFLLPEGVIVESALQSLADFSDSYQAACDEPQPLFRRRV